MKKLLYYLLKIVLPGFTLFGIMGIIVMAGEFDIAGVAIAAVWSAIGLVLILFLLKNKKKFIKNGSFFVVPDQKPISGEEKEENSITETAKNDSQNEREESAWIDSVGEPGDSAQSNNEPEHKERTEITCPRIKDGSPLAYSYHNVEISNLRFDVAMQAANEDFWELGSKIDGEEILLTWKNKLIGGLTGERGNMIRDWIKNGEPFLIFLEGINSEEHKAYAFLAFYRDKRKKMEFREKSVVKLTNYRSEYKQLEIPCIDNGEELELSEEYNDNTGDDYVSVEYNGEEIGRLPKKISDRYLDEGAAGCFFDRSDYDDEKDIYIPFVEIYW